MTHKNNNPQGGRVLILVLIIILVLSAFWFIALSSTGSELLAVGARKSLVQPFYSAESGITHALTEDKDGDGREDFIGWLQGINPENPEDTGVPPEQPPNAVITAWRISSNTPATLNLPQKCPPFPGTDTDTVTECYAIRAVSGSKQVEVGVRMMSSEK